MVVLAVNWMAKVGHESEVAALFSKLTEESRKEPGCLMYQVHRHKTEPRRFFIYEQYKDDAGLESHRAAPHFLQFARKELPRAVVRTPGLSRSFTYPPSALRRRNNFLWTVPRRSRR